MRPSGGGLRFGGGLEVAYRACLWSRLVSRVLLPLWRVEAGSSDAFYTGVRELPWERHLARGATFAVDARARGAAGIHTHFVELKAKDAIVDRLREVWGARPDVDVDDPDFRLHILVDGEEAQLSLDLSGEPLHRRGYRRESGAAPLKENIAAALLLRARWPEVVAAGGALVDPMCGSGTILAEAALLALDIAPGLLRCAPRERFGFRGWRGHDRELWSKLRAEAERRRDAGRSRLPRLAGGDADPEALRLTAASLAAAGIDGVRLERADVGAARPPEGVDGGLVATNAPYGHRVGDRDELPGVYRRLGEALKERFAGWSLALLTADAKLAGEVRMRPFRRNSLWNGSIRCELLQYRIGERPPELERSRAPAH